MFQTPRFANVLLWLTALFGFGLLGVLIWGPAHPGAVFQAVLVTGLVTRMGAEWGHARVWHVRRAQAAKAAIMP